MIHWYHLLRTPIVELDAAAQQLVYYSYYRLVYSDIYFMIRDHFLTEDIIHESFLKAAAKAPDLRFESNIPGWLKQIARRTALDKIKKLKKERQMLPLTSVNINSEAWDEISVISQVENQIRNEQLHLALSQLKPDYRTILLMFYMEGRSYREISRELNLSESVLTQRMARARKKLLEYFIRNWADEDE
ncbi:MAG: RNA polymerase sigma factor [Candidatus Carbobacillus altaicus]|nr:RNA polymerase sigma factor [Candidatus Carbobacillus altaicus]MDY0323564.1 RNA polymerase sigma factor [Candidatus Carbobacillus sp.]